MCHWRSAQRPWRTTAVASEPDYRRQSHPQKPADTARSTRLRLCAGWKRRVAGPKTEMTKVHAFHQRLLWYYFCCMFPKFFSRAGRKRRFEMFKMKGRVTLKKGSKKVKLRTRTSGTFLTSNLAGKSFQHNEIHAKNVIKLFLFYFYLSSRQICGKIILDIDILCLDEIQQCFFSMLTVITKLFVHLKATTLTQRFAINNTGQTKLKFSMDQQM